MKKSPLFLISLIIMCAISQNVWASDSVPVFFAKEEVALARVQDGRSFLPLRSIFERCSARVDYDSSNKLISAMRADGAVLTLRLGSTQANMTKNGIMQDLQLDVTAYADDGITYVPLRFVAESMLCQVDWHNGVVDVTPNFWVGNGVDRLPLWQTEDGEDGIRYFLDYADGVLYEFDSRSAIVRGLGKLPIEGALLGSERYELNLWVDKTGRDNYLLTVELYDRQTALSATGYTYFYEWLEAADVSNNIIVSGNSSMLQSGDCVFLAGKEGFFAVNEGSRQKLHIEPAALGNCCNIVWVNEKYALLNDDRGQKWLLIDLSDGSLQELTSEVLSDKNKTELFSVADVLNQSCADYWQNVGRKGWLEPHPEVQFVEEKDGNLKFRLFAAYSWDSDGNYRYLDVYYDLK